MNANKIKRQRGVILIISIVALIVIGMVSVVLLTKSTSEKTVTHNQQDTNVGEHAAEAAVSKAKQEVTNNWNIGLATCTVAPCTCPAGAPCVWEPDTFDSVDILQQNAAWWNTYATTIAQPGSGLAGAPQYLVIDLGCDTINYAEIFRIVGRGVGGTANSVAFTDITFSMPLNKNNIGTDDSELVEGYLNGKSIFQFYLSPSTMSPDWWVNSTCPNAGSSAAHCELNCAGQVRVAAWTKDTNCIPTYGQWSESSSEINLDLNGKSQSIACQLTAPFGTCFNKTGKIKKCKKPAHKWGYPGWQPDPNFPPN